MIEAVSYTHLGKSTLLYIIGMLEDYDEGEVILYGKDIKKYTQKERRMLYKNKIGFLFQNLSLIHILSDNIELDSKYCLSRNIINRYYETKWS